MEKKRNKSDLLNWKRACSVTVIYSMVLWRNFDGNIFDFIINFFPVSHLGTKKMEYKTRQWHEKCFSCVVCKTAIGTKSFIPREQEVYCATCYEEKFSTRCVKCAKVGVMATKYLFAGRLPQPPTRFYAIVP